VRTRCKKRSLHGYVLTLDSRDQLNQAFVICESTHTRDRFVKGFCTFSIAIMSFKWKGFHITLQYSQNV